MRNRRRTFKMTEYKMDGKIRKLELDHKMAHWLAETCGEIIKAYDDDKGLRFGSGDRIRCGEIIRMIGPITRPEILLPFDIKWKLVDDDDDDKGEEGERRR